MINKKLSQKAVIIVSLLFILGIRPIYARMLDTDWLGRFLITFFLVAFILGIFLKGILVGCLKEKDAIFKKARFFTIQVLEFVGIFVAALHPWPLSLNLLICYLIIFPILNIFLLKGNKPVYFKDIFCLKNYSKGFLLSLVVPAIILLSVFLAYGMN